ncbi:hypothetical protein N7533_003187 [Penicillium manginii]|uniref:uncharacterized protein n=1 Tax=Penicillium manginii TaxID=203109 RepID=UPI0025471DE1|nr:uncharacterized protein N7533_003187 [Penicillium manginii]KAJ5764506.1 hypothetical protein N7533_003187 [Penicillium manginii]
MSPTDHCEETSLVWSYNQVLILMQILRWWVEKEVPASQIGIFLVEALYRMDTHMNHRATKLVDSGGTYGNVAKVVLQYYQIRGERYRPLWIDFLPGDPNLRPELEHAPLHNSSSSGRHSQRPGILHIHNELTLFARKPIRRVRWPFWPSEAELESAPEYQQRYKRKFCKEEDSWDSHLEWVQKVTSNLAREYSRNSQFQNSVGVADNRKAERDMELTRGHGLIQNYSKGLRQWDVTCY